MTPTRTILCVDDDEDDREMVCAAFEDIDPGITVVHAENGSKAHDYLKKAKALLSLPCLILLDLNMPKMDGKETLLEIRKDHTLSKIPLAIFSTSSSEADKAFCRQHGVELVTKPSAFNLVVKEMNRLLQHC